MSRADEGRLIHIAKRRERAKEDIESQRQKLEEERRNVASAVMKTKFTTIDQSSSALSTIGLVTLDEIKEKQNELQTTIDRRILGFNQTEDRFNKNSVKEEVDKTIQKRVLSFADDEEEDSEPVQPIKKRMGMDPTVDTSFLPDKERDEKLIKEREEIAKEWLQIQEKEKNEEINIAFCYWDGSSHRKDTKMKKGTTIANFLQRALEILRKEFSELRIATTDHLMFVKEDLIIPHFYTFFDFIKTRQMGKTGPLWQFDSIGEIRVRQDAALDIGESHPVKVVLRSWYEKNKHIYPASRWEAFVPGKQYKRTIDDLSTI